MDPQRRRRRQRQRAVTRRELLGQINLIVSLVCVLVLNTLSALLESVYLKPPEPYHTSVLSGLGWVIELLLGHNERIRCELGVHIDVFIALVAELRGLGHTHSRSVTLEEQLAIFLYMCVTGITIRHAGERFQRSNDTISR